MWKGKGRERERERKKEAVRCKVSLAALESKRSGMASICCTADCHTRHVNKEA